MEILSLVFKHKNETDAASTDAFSVVTTSVSFMGQGLLVGISQ